MKKVAALVIVASMLGFAQAKPPAKGKVIMHYDGEKTVLIYSDNAVIAPKDGIIEFWMEFQPTGKPLTNLGRPYKAEKILVKVDCKKRKDVDTTHILLDKDGNQMSTWNRGDASKASDWMPIPLGSGPDTMHKKYC